MLCCEAGVGGFENGTAHTARLPARLRVAVLCRDRQGTGESRLGAALSDGPGADVRIRRHTLGRALKPAT